MCPLVEFGHQLSTLLARPLGEIPPKNSRGHPFRFGSTMYGVSNDTLKKMGTPFTEFTTSGLRFISFPFTAVNFYPIGQTFSPSVSHGKLSVCWRQFPSRGSRDRIINHGFLPIFPPQRQPKNIVLCEPAESKCTFCHGKITGNICQRPGIPPRSNTGP